MVRHRSGSVELWIRPQGFARCVIVLGLLSIVTAWTARAAEVKVVSSGGFAAAYKVLALAFERQTGHTVATSWGPSMGTTHDAVPVRFARGEQIDVLIMVGYALDKLVKQGQIASDTRTELARSGIGVVVRAGAPKPDISSVDALRRALLAAKSIAYSDSASGVYIQNEMFAIIDSGMEPMGEAAQK
jgi:molybdate transport system substrate-binding protein